MTREESNSNHLDNGGAPVVRSGSHFHLRTAVVLQTLIIGSVILVLCCSSLLFSTFMLAEEERIAAAVIEQLVGCQTTLLRSELATLTTMTQLNLFDIASQPPPLNDSSSVLRLSSVLLSAASPSDQNTRQSVCEGTSCYFAANRTEENFVMVNLTYDTAQNATVCSFRVCEVLNGSCTMSIASVDMAACSLASEQLWMIDFIRRKAVSLLLPPLLVTATSLVLSSAACQHSETSVCVTLQRSFPFTAANRGTGWPLTDTPTVVCPQLTRGRDLKAMLSLRIEYAMGADDLPPLVAESYWLLRDSTTGTITVSNDDEAHTLKSLRTPAVVAGSTARSNTTDWQLTVLGTSTVASVVDNEGSLMTAVLGSVAIGVILAAISGAFVYVLTRGLFRLAEAIERISDFDQAVSSSSGEVHSTTTTHHTIHGSVFKELDEMARALRIIQVFTQRVRRTFLQQEDEPSELWATRRSVHNELDGTTSTMNRLALPSDSKTAPREGAMMEEEMLPAMEWDPKSTVWIKVRYESRSTTKEFARAKFLFSFDPDVVRHPRGGLIETLYETCLEQCGEDEFQQVKLMYVTKSAEQVVLRNSLQVFEICSSSAMASSDKEDPLTATEPTYGTVTLVMYKATEPRIIVQVTSFADLFNFVSTLVFVARVSNELSASGEDNTTLIAFCCLYVFALGINMCLAVVLLRQAASGADGRFSKWLSLRKFESIVCVVFSTLNLQNFELIWTGVRLELESPAASAAAIRRSFRSKSQESETDTVRVQSRTLLFFNAPPSEDVLYRSIQWSLFGFLFSDVVQLLFKIWQVVSSGDAASVDASYFATLTTSGVSVVFNLTVKMHAMFLWSTHTSTAVQAEGEFINLTQDHTQQTAAMPSSSAMLEHSFVAMDASSRSIVAASSATLLSHKDLTLLLVRAVMSEDSTLRQRSLEAVEWDRFYTTVLTVSRRMHATVLLMHSGMVLLGLNVGRRASEHELDGVHMAFYLKQEFDRWSAAAGAMSISISITSGVYLAGVLGSLQYRTLHVVIPSMLPLFHMNNIGLLFGGSRVSITISRAAAVVALDVDLRNLRRAQVMTTHLRRQQSSASFFDDDDDTRSDVTGFVADLQQDYRVSATTLHIRGQAVYVKRPTQQYWSLVGPPLWTSAQQKEPPRPSAGGEEDGDEGEERALHNDASSAGGPGVSLQALEFGFLFRASDGESAGGPEDARLWSIASGLGVARMDRDAISRPLERLFQRQWHRLVVERSQSSSSSSSSSSCSDGEFADMPTNAVEAEGAQQTAAALSAVHPSGTSIRGILRRRSSLATTQEGDASPPPRGGGGVVVELNEQGMGDDDEPQQQQEMQTWSYLQQASSSPKDRRLTRCPRDVSMLVPPSPAALMEKILWENV